MVLQVLKAKALIGGISIAPFQPCSQFCPPVNATMPSPSFGSGITAFPSELEGSRKVVWSVGFCVGGTLSGSIAGARFAEFGVNGSEVVGVVSSGGLDAESSAE